MSGKTIQQATSDQLVSKNPMSDFVRTYYQAFADTLPSHLTPETFVRLAQATLRQSREITEAAQSNPESFLSALLDCARLGHEPGTAAYAFTVRKNKGVPTIVGIEQYQGVIERMFRAGAVTAVKAECVHKGDRFDWSPTRMRLPVHEFPNGNALASFEERGALVGVYAYAEMQGGAVSRVVVMNSDEVLEHREYAGTGAFWDKHPRAMWRKTAAHELEKWVPTSSEYLRQRAEAAATANSGQSEPERPQPEPAPAQPTPAPVEGEVMDSGDGWPTTKEVPQ